MKRLNFRLGTKSCNGQTFAKPEFIQCQRCVLTRKHNYRRYQHADNALAYEQPISGIRSLAETTSKRENLTAFHLPASQSF